jgi:ethanolamine ammonia-lyase small subunit
MSDETSPEIVHQPEIDEANSTFIQNPWRSLRQLTPSRIALGRSGHSLPTRELLEFQLAHAQARDAVYSQYDPALLTEQLEQAGYKVLQVHSRAANRNVFLRQPDEGRRLSPESRLQLEDYVARFPLKYDALFVFGDGLSAQAIHHHALPVLNLISARLQTEGWRIAPVVVASESRVALGDEIGEVLQAEQVAIFIGERPGLSAAESLGIYLTYKPFVGRLESDRNCISNIHLKGLSYEAATETLFYLMQQARLRQTSGVQLKDERDFEE